MQTLRTLHIQRCGISDRPSRWASTFNGGYVRMHTLHRRCRVYILNAMPHSNFFVRCFIYSMWRARTSAERTPKGKNLGKHTASKKNIDFQIIHKLKT